MEKAGLVVIGASAAGLRCASRVKRLRPHWRVLVLEERETFSYAACGLPYVLSGDIDSLEELRKTAYGLVRDEKFFLDVKGVEVLSGARAVSLDVEDKVVTYLLEGKEHRVAYEALLMATGASPTAPFPIPTHPKVLTFHTWEDVPPIKRGLIRGEISKAVVVGAGPVGCELAEAFRSLWGADVVLVEAADRPLPALVDREVGLIVARELERSGVELLLGDPVLRVEAPSDSRPAVVTKSGRYEGDVVLVGCGVSPRSDLARSAGVRLGPKGGILVDSQMRTSIPGVWAAGDCVELKNAVTDDPVHAPLGSLANLQAVVAADSILGRGSSFPPVVCAATVKVFDLAVAVCGITAEFARKAGIDAVPVWVSCEDKAHYWPEARTVHLQLLVEREDGRLLGLQVVGTPGVVWRAAAAAQLVRSGATYRELAVLEHCYAPPFAPAVDILHLAAFAARNVVEDGLEVVSPLADGDKLSGSKVLDVRLVEEAGRQPWPGAEVIPIDELRPKVTELAESDGRLLVVCERGARSAEAARWLKDAGADVAYLGGGVMWRAAAGLMGDQG